MYHFSVDVVKRSDGRSMLAAAAYPSGARLTDERLGKTFDYGRKKGIVAAQIMAPEGAPEWVHDRGQLWNRVETTEARKDAQLARQVVISLPTELSPEGRASLIFDFVRAHFVAAGMVADVALHDPDAANPQPHVHIHLTMRRLDADGFGPKAREWNDTALLESWRVAWAKAANAALEAEGYAGRLDHRSLEAQRTEWAARAEAAPDPRTRQRALIEVVRLTYIPRPSIGRAAWAAMAKGQDDDPRFADRIREWREAVASKVAAEAEANRLTAALEADERLLLEETRADCIRWREEELAMGRLLAAAGWEAEQLECAGEVERPSDIRARIEALNALLADPVAERAYEALALPAIEAIRTAAEAGADWCDTCLLRLAEIEAELPGLVEAERAAEARKEAKAQVEGQRVASEVASIEEEATSGEVDPARQAYVARLASEMTESAKAIGLTAGEMEAEGLRQRDLALAGGDFLRAARSEGARLGWAGDIEAMLELKDKIEAVEVLLDPDRVAISVFDTLAASAIEAIRVATDARADWCNTFLIHLAEIETRLPALVEAERAAEARKEAQGAEARRLEAAQAEGARKRAERDKQEAEAAKQRTWTLVEKPDDIRLALHMAPVVMKHASEAEQWLRALPSAEIVDLTVRQERLHPAVRDRRIAAVEAWKGGDGRAIWADVGFLNRLRDLIVGVAVRIWEDLRGINSGPGVQRLPVEPSIEAKPARQDEPEPSTRRSPSGPSL